MEQETEGLLNESEFKVKFTRRRNLLPLWIKIFTWLFMLMGIAIPMALIFGALGEKFDLSIYGLATNEPISLLGFLTLSLITFKSITAFSLWFEKDFATDLAKIDTYIGIVICLFMMLVYPIFDNHDGFSLEFRIEVIFLYFFLKKVNLIEYNWAKIKP